MFGLETGFPSSSPIPILPLPSQPPAPSVLEPLQLGVVHRVNHEFSKGQSQQEQGILSGWEAESKSGRDSLPDYKEDRECSDYPARRSPPSCCGVTSPGQPEGNFGLIDGDHSWSELLLAFGVDGSFVGRGRRDMDGSVDSGQGGESSVGMGKSQ